jgi:hypothetical protein
MTVKKAIEILDWWISHKKQSIKQLKKKWDFHSDSVSEVAECLIESDKTAICNLEKIRQNLFQTANIQKR